MFLQTGIISGGGVNPVNLFGDNPNGLDLVLVLDSSGSMDNQRDTVGIRCYDAPTPTCKRLRYWQSDAASTLVDALPYDVSIGVVEFDLDASLILGLTPISTGLSTIHSAIGSLDAEGPTSIGAGIVAAYTEILNNGGSGRSKQIIVFSDGAPTDADYNPIEGTWEVDTQAAMTAGIDAVHSVALPGSSVTIMQGIASIGGGNFIDATNDLSVLDSLYNLN